MSVILGLNCNHADSSACIIKDGKLLIAIEEERINRIKHWAGLPINSIKECLKNSKTNIFYALSLAGDLNLTANRKKIKIIRNNTSSKKMFYVDLTSKDILTNNMMLKSNDIIYVAPLRKRFYAVNSITNIISLSISAVSLYLLISNK